MLTGSGKPLVRSMNASKFWRMPNGQMDSFAVIAGMRIIARVKQLFRVDAHAVKKKSQLRHIPFFITAGWNFPGLLRLLIWFVVHR
jgi:hypothetical protein